MKLRHWTPSSIDGKKNGGSRSQTLPPKPNSRFDERLEKSGNRGAGRGSVRRCTASSVDAPRDWIFGRCSNPLAQRVSSPGTFTRSLAYHTSGGARGLNPRPITIHFGLSAGSSSPRNPFSPSLPCCITIRIRASSAWPVYLSIQWPDSSKRSAARHAIFSSTVSAYPR